ncbi:ion channel [Micromonospora sp. DT81.3]|uniref:ion channel n=1 Tax=Micromonospora sp. DT81.3 TaxID=3416523 RepID=UPI003CEBFDCA
MTWPCAAGDYRVDALYFAVAVFSTVGFGDIGAVTELAWIPRDDSDDPGPDLLGRGSAATNRGSSKRTKAQDRDGVCARMAG